jgi:hypothetical protein
VRDADASAMIPEPFQSAHKDCGPGQNHKNRVLASSKVGCCFCLAIFAPAEIEIWTPGECAVCPYCFVDAVLPESENLTPEFLLEMKKYWF